MLTVAVSSSRLRIVPLDIIRSIFSLSVRTVTTAMSTAQQTSTSGADANVGWLGKEIKAKSKKDPPLAWIYMREGPDGIKRLMPWSERLIWGTVFGGIGFYLGPRIYNARIQAAKEREAANKREEELQQKRVTAARLLLSGKSWVDDQADAFEGMTPKQIIDFLHKHRINPEDPFEGMSPEEIDEFVRQTGAEI